MIKRIQQLNGDTVLEKVEDTPVKVRVSERALLRRKTYLESAIDNFQNELDEVMKDLDELYAENKAEN